MRARHSGLKGCNMAVFTQHSGASADPLVTALLSGASGISVVPGSVQLNASAPSAIGYYDGSLAALGIGAGIIMTSGMMPGTSNTSSSFGKSNGKPGSSLIDAVINPVFYTASYDASTLSFEFTVTDPTATSISFDLVFGSDEYPEWVDAFVDSAVVYVNGVNYAYFNHDPAHPLSVISQNLAAGYFINNNSTGALPIEYDGVSNKLTFVAPIVQGQVNTITIGISDTGDHILDSGVILSSLTAGDLPGSGVVITQPGEETESEDFCVGSGLSEVFNLKGGDDTAYGAGGDDIMAGGAGMDSLDGGSGNDALSGGADDDTLEGGAGDDTASYADDSASYDVVYDVSADTYTVTALGVGSTEGTDTLKNVEKVQFSDGLFQLTSTGLVPATAGSGGGSGGSGGSGTTTNTVGALSLKGVAAIGQDLTANVSDVDGIDGEVTFVWQRSTNGGSSWTSLAETTDTYTVTGADAGADLRVLAAYTDGLGAAEALTSTTKSVTVGATGDLQITLLQIEAPDGSTVESPLTTLVARAIALGLTPNEAQAMVKEVLSLVGDANILQYDPLSAYQANTSNTQAFAWLGAMLQVTILTSLSDDDTATGLVVKMIEAWQAGNGLDLSDVDVLGGILGITPDPGGNHPEPLAEILDRCASIADIITDGGNLADLEIEWEDFASTQETVYVGTIAGLITPINQAPEGYAEGTLSGEAGSAITITEADLLAGFSDPEGGDLSVSGLTADQPGTLLSVAGGWKFTPDEAGAVEFTYSVSDAQGLSTAASKIMVVSAAPAGNSAPVAVDDTVTTAIDVSVTLLPLTNDSDPDADDVITLAGIVSGPSAGGVQIGAGNSATYTPLAYWFGSDSFDYEITDQSGATATATVTVDIAAPEAGWTTGPVSFDTTGTANWAAQFEHFDALGARIGKTTTYDNGRVLHQVFSGGAKVSQIAEDRGDAYTWTSLVKTWDAGTGALLATVTTQDNGMVVEEHFLDGHRVSLAQTDAADITSWTSITDTFGSAGELVSRLRVNDNGTTRDITFVDGVIASQTEKDLGDHYYWTQLDKTFDVSGQMLTLTTTYDDGRIDVVTYEGGVRASSDLTDGGDIFPWAKIEKTWDTATGDLLSKVTTRDNGMVVEELFVGGVRSSLTRNDVGDVASWTSIEKTWNTSTGKLASLTRVEDNGMTTQTLYVNGKRATVTQTDTADTASWTSITDTLNSAGVIQSRVRVNDDGTVRDITYVNGVLSEQTEQDLNDVFDWAQTDRTYDANGDLLTFQTIYDDGRDYLVNYDGGVRTSALMTDVDDAYSWESKAYVYDASGALTDVIVTPDPMDIV
jgi:hypothetical protein